MMHADLGDVAMRAVGQVAFVDQLEHMGILSPTQP